jgi:hypothetical protein
MKILNLLAYAVAVVVISHVLIAMQPHVPAALEPLYNIAVLLFKAVVYVFALILDLLIAILNVIKGILPVETAAPA